jgi:ABC-type multidrug transport system ATPase subunit
VLAGLLSPTAGAARILDQPTFPPSASVAGRIGCVIDGIEPPRGVRVRQILDLKAAALVQRHLSQQAGISAYQDCFMLVVIISLAVMPLIAFLRQRQSE